MPASEPGDRGSNPCPGASWADGSIWLQHLSCKHRLAGAGNETGLGRLGRRGPVLLVRVQLCPPDLSSRVMKIRAAVLEAFGDPLAVQEVDLAEPKGGEVLVRLVACGVCHTDLYTASGADPTGYAPCVLGHEGAGVVERVGEGVTL